MKETQTSKKLTLKKDTLKTLTDKQLGQVAGGMDNESLRLACSDKCTNWSCVC